jgi:oligopeptidase A
MSHPFLNTDFLPDWQSLTADHVQPDITRALHDAQVEIDAISAISPEDATYQTTFARLEQALERFEKAWGLVHHLDSVNNSPDLREAINTMLPQVSQFLSSVPLNEQLYAVLKAAADRPETAELGPTFQRYATETLADFVQQGAELSAERKQRLMQAKQELAEATQKFKEHVLDATNAYEKVVEDESMLAGLPESAKAAARASAEKKGLGSDENPVWRFTLHIPSVLPVLKYAENESLRQDLYEARNAIAATGDFDNTELVARILRLRQEIAELLGKKNFADVVLERRMAGDGTNALRFVEDLHDRVYEAFRNETRELEEFAAAKRGGEAGPLEPWDASFYTEKLRQEKFSLDDEELRPYFSIDRVIGGLFELVEKVFGVSVIERTGDEKPSVWHPEVRFYGLRDGKTNQHLGSFYADWHPRESKRAGAWFNYLTTGARDGDRHEPHLGLICGNLTAPVGDEPALLTHREVQTIFHEFGHLQHHLLGDVPVKSLNGVNVAWDFVELPSQIMENWIWRREGLDLFAKHHQTGKLIPEDLFSRMSEARTFSAATLMMGQLSFGKLDLELHVNYPDLGGRDLDELLEEVLKTYRSPSPTPHRTNVRQFGHLFSGPTGYAAGYYSYKWAEVLEADAFTRFEAEGVLNSGTGRSFREEVLSKGNSRPPEELFRAFMGRDPDPEALLVREGLAEAGQ